jgi:hypothetical protein
LGLKEFGDGYGDERAGDWDAGGGCGICGELGGWGYGFGRGGAAEVVAEGRGHVSEYCWGEGLEGAGLLDVSLRVEKGWFGVVKDIGDWKQLYIWHLSGLERFMTSFRSSKIKLIYLIVMVCYSLI